jgi:hypothetical protein
MHGKEEKRMGQRFQKERNEKKVGKRVERRVNAEGENKQTDSEERQSR